MWKRFLYVVFILFALEMGLFLVFLPWYSELWDHNVVFAVFPRLRPYLLSGYVRGAISGLGLVNIWVGVSDILHFRANLAALDRIEAELASGEAESGRAAGTGSPKV